MSEAISLPRVLLISQWPNVKNGEYELIEKIKQTGYRIAVVDYFGFDVATGVCLNQATLSEEYDFAISFHYDTPKFLNIPTYLWVANPLEFMHLRGDYRHVLLHHLRSYDDYLYNGSQLLKEHIRNVVGKEWRESSLEMFPSCARGELLAPRLQADTQTAGKIFYCGVNWERGIDRAGRAQGLLDILQEKQAADFYGPDKLEGISPWEGFTSYRGEIPFDGVSMSRTMHEYGAVLAVSSPAHMKSRTSSSRVFEGIAAGVPVISDENPHVKHLFGDLVYYFSGKNEEERAASLLAAFQRIKDHPEEARQKVVKAQELMAARFCFEPCFEHVLERVVSDRSTSSTPAVKAESVDVFLFHHDPDHQGPGAGRSFANAAHVLQAARHAARSRQASVRIFCCAGTLPGELSQEPGVEWVVLTPEQLGVQNWDALRLGEKVSLLSQQGAADISVFLTQFDFPAYDYLTKPLAWFAEDVAARRDGVYVAGFFVNDLTQKAPLGTVGIMRNNTSLAMYRWTQNSLAEHQLATLVFGRAALNLLSPDQVSRFDAILPVSIVAAAVTRECALHRSRHLLVRVQCGYFHRHYAAYANAASKGFWSQHYDLVSNYNHELNALYDVHHESAAAIAIADQVSGHALAAIAPVDPAVHMVNEFISRLRPYYRKFKKVGRVFGLKAR